MPRVARVTHPGHVHHVISRFIDREFILRSPIERRRYFDLFARSLDSTDWRCLAYALMSSHLHFAMMAGKMPPESWLKATNSPFANWFNLKNDRIGPVFAQRADMWAVEDQRVGDLIAYIHNNPVRANVVQRATKSTWTSHKAYVKGRGPEWLHVDEGLERAGFIGPAAGARFDAWVNESVGLRTEGPGLAGIDRQARRRGGITIGTPIVGNRLDVPLVARPFARIRPDPSELIRTVSEITKVAYEIIASRDRSATAERRIAIHIGKAMGVSLSDMASAIGFSPQAASHLQKQRLTADEDAVVRVVGTRVGRT